MQAVCTRTLAADGAAGRYMPAVLRARPRSLVLACLVALLSCGDDTPVRGSPGTASMFVVPTSLDELSGERFFEHPFPSDLRREPDEKARFSGWPNPFSNVLVREYVKATEGLLDGFSPAAPAYLRFTGPIDAESLPRDPPASIAADASVQLVDVDPTSPERGRRRLVQTHWQETVADGSYWQPNTLAVMPILGRPLRPKTRYAVVVTNKLRAKDGGPIARSADLEEVLGTRPASERTQKMREIFAPALVELETAGIAVKDIVHLTVFTTSDPTAEVFAIADHVKTSFPAPKARDWTAKETTADYDVYEGTYGPSPNFQIGAIPYRKPADGGGFVFENGTPKLQDMFDLRFALVVPKEDRCPQPAEGHPVVLYAHGTGGDYRSFIDDGTARALAQRCLASMGIDQIFHGTRPGAPPADDPQRDTRIQLLFFNLDNAFAARTNNRQSAIDVVQQARLFTESRTKVPASVSRTSREIAFDPSRVLFFGHSQGGLNGPLFLAASDLARGGVLSGAGSMLIVALLEKTSPVDVSGAVRLLLGLSSEDRAKELNVFHPALALAQSLVDATDPIHYGAFITTSPRPGFAPKSIFQTEGIAPDGSGDTYSPPHGIEALAVSMSLPRVAPGVRPIIEAAWAGLGDVAIPPQGVSGNIADGRATGALAQFVPTDGSDGHFVVFRNPTARAQAAIFCRDLADVPIGRLSPLSQ
jgi:predicted esterase